MLVQYNKEGWIIQRYQELFENSDELYTIDLSQEQYNQICVVPIGYEWRIINGKLQLDIYDSVKIQQEQIFILRHKRKNLLQAFDIYKTNVFYGIESDTNHNAIILWYQLVLDLNEEAINNPPQEIKKYIQ